MSESAGRVVAWQRRIVNGDEGPGLWTDCSEADAKFLSNEHYAGIYETRALVPEQLLVASEAIAAEHEKNWLAEAEKRIDLEIVIGKVLALADEWKKDGRYLHSQIFRDCTAQLRALTQTPTEAVKK